MNAPQNVKVNCPNCTILIRTKQLERHLKDFCTGRVPPTAVGAAASRASSQSSNDGVNCIRCGLTVPRDKFDQHVAQLCGVQKNKSALDKPTLDKPAPISSLPRSLWPLFRPKRGGLSSPPVPSKSPSPPNADTNRREKRRAAEKTARKSKLPPQCPPSNMPSDSIAGQHRKLTELARANKPERTWVPMREEKVVFRNAYKNPHSGNTHRAHDYGFRAFPILQKGKHSNVASKKEGKPVPHYDPINSGCRLLGGFAAGDRICHATWGNGTILSISHVNTVFNFDILGLRSLDTPTVHADLKRISPTQS
jgi:hypothetical protein